VNEAAEEREKAGDSPGKKRLLGQQKFIDEKLSTLSVDGT